jgi:hypothetical protein
MGRNWKNNCGMFKIKYFKNLEINNKSKEEEKKKPQNDITLNKQIKHLNKTSKSSEC